MSWPPRSARGQGAGGAPAGSSSLPLGGHDPMSMGALRESLSMSKVIRPNQCQKIKITNLAKISL